MTICQQSKDLFNTSKVNHQSHQIYLNIRECLKFSQLKTQKLCLIGLKCLCKLVIFDIKKKKKKTFYVLFHLTKKLQFILQKSIYFLTTKKP